MIVDIVEAVVDVVVVVDDDRYDAVGDVRMMMTGLDERKS